MAKPAKGREPRPLSFYPLAAFFGLFVLFLYGPIATIVILSFQGPNGGLTFPMNGVSVHWFRNLFETQAVRDFGGSLSRSLALGVIVMLITVLFAVSAGLAFRRRFFGSGVIFYIAVASLIVPSILVSLGIGLMFNIMGWEPNWYSSALGAHLTWTLPFGLLIMFAVFNRFDRSYEEAARDLYQQHLRLTGEFRQRCRAQEARPTKARSPRSGLLSPTPNAPDRSMFSAVGIRRYAVADHPLRGPADH